MKLQGKFKASVLIMLFCILSSNINAGIFDSIVPVRIATNMNFTEGPAWHPGGFLVFSDIDGNVIYKWSETSGLETFVNPAGNSNGIECTKTNGFVVCRQGARDIATMNQTGAIMPYITQYNGKKFNSPNDVTLSYLGSIYFTDPDFGANTLSRELSFEGLYCIPYNKSEAILIDSTLVKPNGLTFVNDWRTLYVCESSTNKIYSYYLRDEYLIPDFAKDKKVFLSVGTGGEIDGITSDMFGNIYVAFGDGGVMIFDKDAKEIGHIAFPEKVRNLCLGGKHNNTLFVTAGNSLYRAEIRFWGDFIAPGLLGVPTDNSVIFNAISDMPVEAYIAYGTNTANFIQETPITKVNADVPLEIQISNLTANTYYYYQLFYKPENSPAFIASTSGNFFTQRAKGEVFSFAVEADPHLDEGSNYLTYRNMLQNASNLKPDFLIDLGDNFMVEKFPVIDSFYIEQRNLLYRNFWDKVCNSIPLFIVQGNHDTELRWLSTNQNNDPFNMATRIRKRNYPTPEPDSFYSGSEVVELFTGRRENYYAWNWGDALFVVIDPYGYTSEKTADPWCFTMGKTQYDWFSKTLLESKARYKFVFAHQLVGGDELGRGGVEKADYFENGGMNTDGSYGFDIKRPGWGKPLHQIMAEAGVQIYFHGHDHFYAEQEKDGIIYQEVPQPSFPGYTIVNDAAKYGYTTGTIIPNSGHINVKILGDSAQVDYIGAYHTDNKMLGQINGTSRRTYFIKANNITSSVEQNEINKTRIEAYQSGGYLYIKSANPVKGQVFVYSLTGQISGAIYNGLISGGTTVYKIPDNLSRGIYIISITTKNSKSTVKIII